MLWRDVVTLEYVGSGGAPGANDWCLGHAHAKPKPGTWCDRDFAVAKLPFCANICNIFYRFLVILSWYIYIYMWFIYILVWCFMWSFAPSLPRISGEAGNNMSISSCSSPSSHQRGPAKWWATSHGAFLGFPSLGRGLKQPILDGWQWLMNLY